MNNMLQVKKSNRPKVGLTALAVALLTVLTVFFAGCKKDKESEPVDPFVTEGNTPNPNWVIAGENDMSSSMTSIVKVSFAKSEGTLAAFIGNECRGIATYKADYGLYWLYISPTAEGGGNVQLRFYSPELKRIFEATSTFPFRNDIPLGYITEPYTPEWKEKQ
jgi:hypothetical protein